MHRPAEELYHTSEDPFEHKNLAGDPKYAAVKARLSAELDSWMEQQKDPGIALDTHAALQTRRRAAAAKKKSKPAE
jgi:uncharacterized sulfatase